MKQKQTEMEEERDKPIIIARTFNVLSLLLTDQVNKISKDVGGENSITSKPNVKQVQRLLSKSGDTLKGTCACNHN